MSWSPSASDTPGANAAPFAQDASCRGAICWCSPLVTVRAAPEAVGAVVRLRRRVMLAAAITLSHAAQKSITWSLHHSCSSSRCRCACLDASIASSATMHAYIGTYPAFPAVQPFSLRVDKAAVQRDRLNNRRQNSSTHDDAWPVPPFVHFSLRHGHRTEAPRARFDDA